MILKPEDFTKNIFYLLGEFFESPPVTGSSCIDQKTGLLDTLDALSAEQASKRVGEQNDLAPSVAAHCEHVRFYNDILFRDLKGETIGKIAWKESWLVQSVSDDEWQTLRSTLKRQYRDIVALLETLEVWYEYKLGDSIEVLAHTAYHLGAIRQLLRFV